MFLASLALCPNSVGLSTMKERSIESSIEQIHTQIELKAIEASSQR